jgi:hypothetical protein
LLNAFAALSLILPVSVATAEEEMIAERGETLRRRNENKMSSLRRPGLSDLSPCVLAANDLNRSLAGDSGRWMARIPRSF